MSEFKEVDDRKFGQYVLNSSDFSGSIDAEELANACRRLGISGPLEPLLRDLKKKNDKYVTPSSPATKESPRKTSQRKEKRASSNSKTRQSPEQFHSFNEPFDSRGGSAGGGGGGGGGSGSGFGKNSYGKESWGRDSGARDLSPEPNMHRMHETLSVEAQPMDTETGGTSAMLHLASKVRLLFFIVLDFFLLVFKFPRSK